MEANYYYAKKNQRGAKPIVVRFGCDELVLYGIRLLAQATLWSSRPMIAERRWSSTNESGPVWMRWCGPGISWMGLPWRQYCTEHGANYGLGWGSDSPYYNWCSFTSCNDNNNNILGDLNYDLALSTCSFLNFVLCTTYYIEQTGLHFYSKASITIAFWSFLWTIFLLLENQLVGTHYLTTQPSINDSMTTTHCSCNNFFIAHPTGFNQSWLNINY